MIFISKKHSALHVVLDPRIRINTMGRTTTESLTGQTKLGLSVQFRENLFETDDPVIIKALKEHPEYGLSFRSDEKVKVEPTVEAVTAENEKAAVAEELRSTCPECGTKFKNEFALNGHLRSHNK